MYHNNLLVVWPFKRNGEYELQVLDQAIFVYEMAMAIMFDEVGKGAVPAKILRRERPILSRNDGVKRQFCVSATFSTNKRH